MTPSNSFSSLAEFAFAMDLGDGSRASHFVSQWDDTLPLRADSPRPRHDSSDEEESEEERERVRERQQRSRASKQVAKLLQVQAAHRCTEGHAPVPVVAGPKAAREFKPLVTPPVRIPTMALRADETG